MPIRTSGWPAVVLGAGLATVLATGLVIERFGLLPQLAFAIQRAPRLLPSTTGIAPSIVATGVPILSLQIKPSDLNDPQSGLMTHRLEHGRAWQRPGFVSYFDRGELLFGAQAGVRIHGGKSRQFSPVQSFRLHFEKQYGADQFRPDVLFGSRSDPIRRLVVHNDLRQDHEGRWWHFTNPLAFDIATRLGAVTPQTQLARVFLNGQPQGAYVLTEHVTSKGFLRSRFGHSNFTIADPRTIERTREWVRRQRPLTMARVNEAFDVENLTKWFVSMLFCATTDAYQGVQLRDNSLTHGRWFWVIWDMDHSFMDLYGRARVPWEHDTFHFLLRKPEIRSELMTRMLVDDPAYVAYFKRTLADALNHRLTPGFLTERFNYYGRATRALRVPDTEYLGILNEFLIRRPAAVRELASRYLPDGRSFHCEVTAPPGTPFRVDRVPLVDHYDGWYFEGMPIRVEIDDRVNGFSHWLVNGEPRGTGSRLLELPIDEDTRIEAVFR
jgi:hypothetical protein